MQAIKQHVTINFIVIFIIIIILLFYAMWSLYIISIIKIHYSKINVDVHYNEIKNDFLLLLEKHSQNILLQCITKISTK